MSHTINVQKVEKLLNSTANQYTLFSFKEGGESTSDRLYRFNITFYMTYMASTVGEFRLTEREFDRIYREVGGDLEAMTEVIRDQLYAQACSYMFEVDNE